MGRVIWKCRRSVRTAGPLAEHIGKQILKQRQKHQWTIRKLATRAQLSHAFLCALENGKSQPTAETLWKLSKACDAPLSYWFRGYEDK